jgi:hypothetical protein
VDPAVAEAHTGHRPDGLPTAREQLTLIRDRLLPLLERPG